MPGRRAQLAVRLQVEVVDHSSPLIRMLQIIAEVDDIASIVSGTFHELREVLICSDFRFEPRAQMIKILVGSSQLNEERRRSRNSSDSAIGLYKEVAASPSRFSTCGNGLSTRLFSRGMPAALTFSLTASILERTPLAMVSQRNRDSLH